MKFHERLIQCLIVTSGLLLLQVGMSHQCDLKWIRFMYMVTCGKKKRNLTAPPNLLPQLLLNSTVTEAPLLTRNSTMLKMFISKSEKPSRNPNSDALPKWNVDPRAPWSEEELADDDINEVDRREIGKLLQKCCKIPPVSACSAKDFVGACK